jgi:hypothetical protein
VHRGAGEVPVDFLEVVETGDQLVERRARLGFFDAALNVFDVAGQHRLVEVFNRVGQIGDDGEALLRDFGEAAKHDDLVRAAARVHRQDAGAQGRDDRRVTFQHAEVTLDTGDVDLLDFAREHELFRRHQFEMQSHRPLASPAGDKPDARPNDAADQGDQRDVLHLA